MTISPLEMQQRLLSEVSTSIAANDFRRAYDAASMGLMQGMRHPALYNARGLWLQRTGNFQQALGEFQNALAMSPRNPVILNAIGLCLQRLGRLQEAVAAFDQALAGAPDASLTHLRKGKALADLGEHDSAQSCYERAIGIDSNCAEAIASLASILARKGQSDEARALAEQALALNPDEPIAKLALAILEISEKKFTEAEQRLRGLLENKDLGTLPRAAILALIGDALDGQKRYAEAFAIYRQKNQEVSRQFSRLYGGEMGLEAARNLASYFENAPPERWQAADDAGDPPQAAETHVFLAGFLRSGTTLLEQVLACNPNIDALEEKALLSSEGEKYLTSVEGLEALANLSAAEARQIRCDYWERVKAAGLDVRGRIFVDKQPLNTTKLPIIAKVFPRAKILLALRDPRDVVFSCYRRHFGVNPTMFAFLDLESAARLYSSIMGLTELYRAKLQLNVFEHRYEDMVADFEERVRAVCDFIGIPWDDSMREFNKYVPAIDLRSPSAMQVRKPLYSDALAQWRRYADQLQPILPIVKPWAVKFGYPAE